MPKSATKAVGNAFYEARIEAAKCNDRLASREGAAEELGIDRTRLARIELGSLIPYPEEVLLMSETYDAPQLTNHYCSACCPLGKETIPPCELLQILTAFPSRRRSTRPPFRRSAAGPRK